jgi:DNA polymerase I-like protein with 3'-5' exonuclease and polymerase domains
MAKELVIPPEGYGIVSADLSQIEFRVIVHYLENERCCSAYRRNPWTDFHIWVAKSVPTKRKPAKTLNFMLGYGGGKKKTVAVLSQNKDLVGELIAIVERDASIPPEHKLEAARHACELKATKVYDGYHRLLPELKPTTRAAMYACMNRGFARNHYGRRCYKTKEAAWAAFNTVCQGTAGDLFKDRLIGLRDDVPEFLQTAVVHDQVVGLLPLETLQREAYFNGGNDETLRRITKTMNSPSRPLRVPIRTGIGWSDHSWAEAQSDACEQKFD